MRHRWLVTLLSLVGLAALVATTGCGVAADDTAATVGGTVIKASLVDELATSDPFMTAMTSQALKDQREGVVDGDDARQVLAFLIQKEVLAQQVDEWDAEVTDQDRRQAEATIAQQAPQLTESQRRIVAGFLADRDALGARLKELSATKASDLRALYDSLGSYWDKICLTAVAVPADAQPAAQRALDRGTKLVNLPKRVKSAQVVTTDRQCVAGSNLPTVLRSDVHRSRTGVVVGPVTGIYPGDQAVLYYVVGSRRHVSFEQARDELGQIARAVAQQGIAAWLTLKVNQDVTVSPRYGTDVEVGQSGLSVTAPALPLGASTADAAAGASAAGQAGTPPAP